MVGVVCFIKRFASGSKKSGRSVGGGVEGLGMVGIVGVVCFIKRFASGSKKSGRSVGGGVGSGSTFTG